MRIWEMTAELVEGKPVAKFEKELAPDATHQTIEVLLTKEDKGRNLYWSCHTVFGKLFALGYKRKSDCSHTNLPDSMQFQKRFFHPKEGWVFPTSSQTFKDQQSAYSGDR